VDPSFVANRLSSSRVGEPAKTRTCLVVDPSWRCCHPGYVAIPPGPFQGAVAVRAAPINLHHIGTMFAAVVLTDT
jgi:hypothetical protein